MTSKTHAGLNNGGPIRFKKKCTVELKTHNPGWSVDGRLNLERRRVWSCAARSRGGPLGPQIDRGTQRGSWGGWGAHPSHLRHCSGCECDLYCRPRWIGASIVIRMTVMMLELLVIDFVFLNTLKTVYLRIFFNWLRYLRKQSNMTVSNQHRSILSLLCLRLFSIIRSEK